MGVRRLAFINGKGGCGKTTSIFHVAGVLSKQGEKVLVIDLDKQRNMSDILLMNTEFPPNTVFDFLMGSCDVSDTVQKSLFQTRGNAKAKYFNVDCMVADINLEDESKLFHVDRLRVQLSLNSFIEERGYTWVLVDMPPSNKMLNELCFGYIVDYVVVPFSSDIFSVKGYGDIMNTMEYARKENPSLSVLGVYLARYMKTSAVDKYIRDELLKFDAFIDIQVPLSADVRESIMFGRPISFYKTISDSKSAYEQLVRELVRLMKLNY